MTKMFTTQTLWETSEPDSLFGCDHVVTWIRAWFWWSKHRKTIPWIIARPSSVSWQSHYFGFKVYVICVLIIKKHPTSLLSKVFNFYFVFRVCEANLFLKIFWKLHHCFSSTKAALVKWVLRTVLFLTGLVS